MSGGVEGDEENKLTMHVEGRRRGSAGRSSRLRAEEVRYFGIACNTQERDGQCLTTDPTTDAVILDFVLRCGAMLR